MAADKILYCLLLVLFSIITPSHSADFDEECRVLGDCNPTSTFMTCVPEFRPGQVGTCRCRPETVHNGTHCIGQANGPCGIDFPPYCVPGANCNGRQCICDAYYYPKPISASGELYCRGLYGQDCSREQSCDSNLTCTRPDPIDMPETQQCLCDNTTQTVIWGGSRQKCVILDGGYCYSNLGDDQCIDNAQCLSNQCTCAPLWEFEYEVSRQRCARKIDQPCAIHADCNEDRRLVCDATSRKCSCRVNEIYDDISRICKKLVGGSCLSQSECGGDSSCHIPTGVCFCDRSQNMVTLEDTRTCGRMNGSRDGYCESDDNCVLGEYLTCEKATGATIGQCRCQPGMQSTENGCRHLAGQSCPINHACVQNAACIDNSCLCLPGTIRTGDNLCRKTYDETSCNNLSDPCNSEQGLICSGSRCICPIGQEWSIEKSHCVVLVSGNCDTSEFCTLNSHCSARGVCECNAGYSVHYRHREQLPDDRYRICLPSYNTTCNGTVSINERQLYCNDEEFLACDSTSSTCKCRYPKQQEWDASLNSCASVPGGFCGALSELWTEVGRRDMQCIGFSSCETVNEADVVGRCKCNVGYSVNAEEGNLCRRASGAMRSMNMSGISLTAILSLLGFYAVMS